MKKVVHISNTDLFEDSRIQKEIFALKNLPKVNITVFGVPNYVKKINPDLNFADYIELSLKSKVLFFLPRFIRYFFELIEFTFRVTVKCIKIKPDVVHCHDTFALPSGWLIKKLFSSKLIYDAHELESNKNGQNVILSKATLYIEKLCWQKIDVLITVSDKIRTWYDQNLGLKKGIVILNSPIIKNDNLFNQDVNLKSKYFHSLYKLDSNDIVFIYLGYLSKGRGIEICLNTFSKIQKKCHVVFVGSGELETLIAKYSNLHSNIHLHQPVNHENVVSLVKSADWGLCLLENASLSDYYSLPNKIFEYSFADLKIIASNFPEIDKLVNEFSLGYTCEPNFESLLDIVSFISNNNPKFANKDISDLSWDNQALKLNSMYEREILI
jgi:glycosyltransferase involved in cell wall biosynthesis